EIAQVLVNDFLTLTQIVDASLCGAHAYGVRHMKNVIERRRGDQNASPNHMPVSLRACSRKRVSSSPRTGAGTLACVAIGRFLHIHTMSTTSVIPTSNARYGMSQATRLKPRFVGAASTSVPQVWPESCVMALSESSQSTADAGSC